MKTEYRIGPGGAGAYVKNQTYITYMFDSFPEKEVKMKNYVVVFIGISRKFNNFVKANTPKEAVAEVLKSCRTASGKSAFTSKRTNRKSCDFIVKDTNTKKYSYFALV